MNTNNPDNATRSSGADAGHTAVAVVVIGRNEGERLVTCLQSLAGTGTLLVYVDSGSTDGSIAAARAHGAIVVELDRDRPFTAGRARNTGFRAVMETAPATQYVQFVDGDCEVVSGWVSYAANYLDAHPAVAIVCGRRRERFPERTLFNQLCDMEWDTPIGEAAECGGDFMARADAFAAVGGFDDAIIAGEEPELCYRLRAQGWRITRADQPMTIHDANITSLSQWARRTARAGYAYAARAMMHRGEPGAFCWRENLRIFLWAAALPAAALVLALAVSPWAILLLLLYPLQFLKIWKAQRDASPAAPAAAYAFFTILGRWPEFWGQVLFLFRFISGREQRIIEYK